MCGTLVWFDSPGLVWFQLSFLLALDIISTTDVITWGRAFWGKARVGERGGHSGSPVPSLLRPPKQQSEPHPSPGGKGPFLCAPGTCLPKPFHATAICSIPTCLRLAGPTIHLPFGIPAGSSRAKPGHERFDMNPFSKHTTDIASTNELFRATKFHWPTLEITFRSWGPPKL